MARVHLGVALVTGGQGAARPIARLVFLAVLNAEQIFQHVGQADALIAADARSRHRIENAVHIEVEVALLDR